MLTDLHVHLRQARQQLLARLLFDHVLGVPVGPVLVELAAVALLVLAVSAVLRIGPNMTPSWRSTLIGGVVFAVGWLIATFGFALYVANFADYGATYGALAGVIVGPFTPGFVADRGRRITETRTGLCRSSQMRAAVGSRVSGGVPTSATTPTIWCHGSPADLAPSCPSASARESCPSRSF